LEFSDTPSLTPLTMTLNQIQLAPAQTLVPQYGHVPYQQARRWYSPHEGDLPKQHLEVFLTQGAYIRACAHAGSDLDNEVGGWLIGKWRVDKKLNQEFIVIEKILPASYTKQGRAYLTFTHDSQVAMLGVLEKRYPGKTILGWYHTHPRMGIFMSHYDTWLHQNFFQGAWQVALVIEPHTAAGGFFIPNERGQLDALEYFGFHELTNRTSRSVVHWDNLRIGGIHTNGGKQDE